MQKAYQLDGFENGNGTYTTNEANAAGVRVRIGFNDSDQLIYEAAIPFAAFYKKSQLTAEDAAKPIAVCFTINGLSKPTMDANGAPPGGGGFPPPPGGGGPPRGSTPARASGSNSSAGDFEQMERLFQSTKTWKFVAPAKKQ